MLRLWIKGLIILGLCWVIVFTYWRWERLMRMEEKVFMLMSPYVEKYEVERKFNILKWCWHTTINPIKLKDGVTLAEYQAVSGIPYRDVLDWNAELERHKILNKMSPEIRRLYEKSFANSYNSPVSINFNNSFPIIGLYVLWFVFCLWLHKKEVGMEKRKQLTSLLSMMAMAFIAFMVVGVCINWNLFIVIGCFIPILLIGIGVIYMPDQAKKVHGNLQDKIDKKITNVGKQIHEATK